MGWFENAQQNRDRRQQNREDRRDSRYDRQGQRQSNRNERQFWHDQRKSIAYENGIDPNAWIANTTKAGTSGAADILASIFGLGGISGDGKNSPFSFDNLFGKSEDLTDQERDKRNNTIMLMGGVGILALLLMNKK